MSIARKLWHDTRGAGIIEAAIILPIFVLLMFGIIEYGYYLVRSEMLARSVSTVALAIQNDPGDPSTTQALANNSGGGAISFGGTSGNYICAKAYKNLPSSNSTLCASGDWKTQASDAGVSAGTIYYVGVQATVPYLPLTPSGSTFGLGNHVQSQIIQVGGSNNNTAVSGTTCGLRSAFCVRGMMEYDLVGTNIACQGSSLTASCDFNQTGSQDFNVTNVQGCPGTYVGQAVLTGHRGTNNGSYFVLTCSAP